MLVIIDNYDSFVYNIVHWIDVPEDYITVIRNDAFSVEDMFRAGDVRGIILSPGPMGPDSAGISNDLIMLAAQTRIPVLGICLGHQSIGHAFGCKIERHPIPTHGKPSEIKLGESEIFAGLPPVIAAGRYHSLCVSEHGFNHYDLKITARLLDGTIMGIEHRSFPIFGVQFHPESILTGEPGRQILRNFAKLAQLHIAQSEGCRT